MLVRELAEARRVGITQAIKDAVKDALNRRRTQKSLWEATADIRAMLAANPRTGLTADKAFYDTLSGHGDSDSRREPK